MSFRLAVALLAVALTPPVVRADDPEFGGKKLSAWLTMLKEDSLPRKRKAAVIAVGQIAADDRDARTVVLSAFGKALRTETNPGVRSQIAVLLGQQSPEDGGLFLADLSEAVRIERDSATRREMAVSLGRYGKAARPAVVPLAAATKDALPATRAAVAEALGRIGPDARPATVDLLPLTRDADRAVRRAAVYALGRIDPEDPAPVTAAFVGVLAADRAVEPAAAAGSAVGSAAVWAGRRDDAMVLEVVVAFGLLGDRSPEVVQAVAGHLTDPSADIRRQSALTLAKFGPAARAAEKPLAEQFRADADKLVRIYSLQALRGGFGTEAGELVPLFVGRLTADADAEVRVAIADELGGMGPAGKAAIPALREAQRDPQIKVREAAAAAIKAIQKPAEKPRP